MKPALFSFLTLLFSIVSGDALLKVYKTDSAQSTMVISGTSTLHDWDMKAMNLKGSIDVDQYEEALKIKTLKLDVPVEALKSGKKAMDNNAYKALKRDDYPTIRYELISVKDQKKISSNIFNMTTRGKLSVAGKTRIMEVPIQAVTSNEGIRLTGNTTFNMSSFDVEAPSFMMGAVSTGDEITIHFSINYN